MGTSATQTLPVKPADKDTDKIQMEIEADFKELMIWERIAKSEEKLEGKRGRKRKKVHGSANSRSFVEAVLHQPVKLSKIKSDKKELCHVACRCDGRAYNSGRGIGIVLIDRSRSHQDTITTSGEPSGLGVMKDGSLIYSVLGDGAIYQVFPDGQSRTLINITDSFVLHEVRRNSFLKHCFEGIVVSYCNGNDGLVQR
jgi:hypothetical protein